MNLSRLERYIFLLTPNFLLRRLLPLVPKFNFFNETKLTQTPITFNMWYSQKVTLKSSKAYWPVHETSIVQGWKNIYCGIETCPGFSFGNYISANYGKIYIGDYTQIAPNVGLIAENHSLHDNRIYESQDIVIGKYCWIGMGAIILPGVILGDYTIVGAGSIVTKSFKEGYQVIGGNPARVLKELNQMECVHHESEKKYNGYIKNEEFEIFQKKELNI